MTFARTAAQNLLQFLKFEKLEELEAQGLLRSGAEFHFGANLLPAISIQVRVEHEFPKHVDQTISQMLKNATNTIG